MIIPKAFRHAATLDSELIVSLKQVSVTVPVVASLRTYSSGSVAAIFMTGYRWRAATSSVGVDFLSSAAYADTTGPRCNTVGILNVGEVF